MSLLSDWLPKILQESLNQLFELGALDVVKEYHCFPGNQIIGADPQLYNEQIEPKGTP